MNCCRVDISDYLLDISISSSIVILMVLSQAKLFSLSEKQALIRTYHNKGKKDYLRPMVHNNITKL